MPTRVFHPVPFTSECHVRYQHGTNLLENTFAYIYGSTPTNADLLSLATEIGVGLALRMAAMMHNGVVMREVYCRNLDVEFANNATYTFPSGTTGQRAGSPLASNEAMSIVKRTGTTGRGMHGRNSFSEFIEPDADGNTLSAFLLNLVLAVIIEILTYRVSGKFAPALAKRMVTPPRSVLLRSALALDNNVDSQKTRLNSHGR
jgi:hypothetical protein